MMFFRRISILLLVVLFTSCQFFFKKKNRTLQEFDTIVDFSKVDVSPSFSVCDSLIDKTKKENCFRTSLHQILSSKLSTHTFNVHQKINETVTVHLFIDKKGVISLQQVSSSEIIKKELPTLDSLLKVSLQNIPSLHPAIKRGIPVATQYQLPIKILFDD